MVVFLAYNKPFLFLLYQKLKKPTFIKTIWNRINPVVYISNIITLPKAVPKFGLILTKFK